MRQLTLMAAAFLLAASSADRATAETAPAERREGFVTAADGVKIYYVEKGSGKDVLVVPVALYLEDLLAPLAEDRRVIFYDPRHRGRSGAGDLENATLDRQIADLETLRAELGLEKMMLLGWSGLGMEMAAYAIRHPDRVTRLVQIGAVPPAASIMREAGGDARASRVDRAAVEALDARAEAGAFEGAAQEEYCRERNRLTLPASFADPAFVDQVPDVCVHENEWPENLWPFFGAYLPSFGEYDWRDELNDLDIPRLVIHGKEDGIPVAGAYAWAAGYPDARLIVVSPAGHFPFIEKRDEVMSAVETFLDGAWPETAQIVAADHETN